jgi:hypothetical protein
MPRLFIVVDFAKMGVTIFGEIDYKWVRGLIDDFDDLFYALNGG